MVAIKTIFIFASLTLCCGQSYDQNAIKQYGMALDAVLGMGIRLQTLLDENTHENFLISPLSVTAVIGQLMLGAEDKFQEQLYDLLSLPKSDLHKNDKIHLYGKSNSTYKLPYSTLHVQLSSLLKALTDNSGNYTLKLRNGVFYNKHINLKSMFSNNLKLFYLSDLIGFDFTGQSLNAQRHINEWGSNHTNGLIKNVLLEPPNEMTSTIFSNAIYFLADWETPFSDELNFQARFNVTRDKHVSATYMYETLESVKYVNTTDYEMVCIPYVNEEVGMYVILPSQTYAYNITGFLRTLNITHLMDSARGAWRRSVSITMPKMQLSTRFSILKQLQKYAEYRNKTTKAKSAPIKLNPIDELQKKLREFTRFRSNDDSDIYLTNAAIDEDLRINDIVQQIVFSVNEKGTEAAAITVSTADRWGGSIHFRMMRPFVFFIKHEATSAILFWGTISDPTA